MKYRRGRPVTLHAAQSGESVVVTVTNHGPWIGPKPTFERFQRGETRRSVQGYGVGLWLTRRLAEAHGGGLAIRAERAQTQAIIRLPATKLAGRAPAANDSPRRSAVPGKVFFQATLLQR